MVLQKDLREFIELLNSHKVDYLIVGGHAVAFHGYPRFTGPLYIEKASAVRRYFVIGATMFASRQMTQRPSGVFRHTDIVGPASLMS
jgi:hypothetical protein